MLTVVSKTCARNVACELKELFTDQAEEKTTRLLSKVECVKAVESSTPRCLSRSGCSTCPANHGSVATVAHVIVSALPVLLFIGTMRIFYLVI